MGTGRRLAGMLWASTLFVTRERWLDRTGPRPRLLFDPTFGYASERCTTYIGDSIFTPIEVELESVTGWSMALFAETPTLYRH